MNLLNGGKKSGGDSDAHLRATAQKLEETLQNFGVGVHVTNASCGPSVTRYELQPDQGVKVSRIVGLADDIKLNLAVADLRIEAPIPGKAAVGIEVENTEASPVLVSELIASKEFQEAKSKISFVVGKDIDGNNIVADLHDMPHLLIAGATGSGKSVCINTIITSLLYKATPDEVRLVLVDPKVVELGNYNGIPHLLIPVVTDPKKAAAALNWACHEMDQRYRVFAEKGVKDLKSYNSLIRTMEPQAETMPEIVIIIDIVIDIDVDRDNIDALCFAGHKGLMALQGIGGMVLSERAARLMKPLIHGGTELLHGGKDRILVVVGGHIGAVRRRNGQRGLQGLALTHHLSGEAGQAAQQILLIGADQIRQRRLLGGDSISH